MLEVTRDPRRRELVISTLRALVSE
jgi:hypothetical protein